MSRGLLHIIPRRNFRLVAIHSMLVIISKVGILVVANCVSDISQGTRSRGGWGEEWRDKTWVSNYGLRITLHWVRTSCKNPLLMSGIVAGILKWHQHSMHGLLCDAMCFFRYYAACNVSRSQCFTFSQELAMCCFWNCETTSWGSLNLRNTACLWIDILLYIFSIQTVLSCHPLRSFIFSSLLSNFHISCFFSFYVYLIPCFSRVLFL